jgi:hypothetical protein
MKKWYQKTSIQAAIISGIFMLIAAGISVFKYSTKETVIQVSTKGIESHAKPSHYSIPITFEQYIEKLQSLEDRFLEKEEFGKSLENKEVNWAGYVEQVFSYPKIFQDDDTSLGLVMKDENIEKDFGYAIIQFDEGFKTKLFSLRKNDKIKIQGVVKKGVYPPTIKGISFELIPTPKAKGKK